MNLTDVFFFIKQRCLVVLLLRDGEVEKLLMQLPTFKWVVFKVFSEII